MIKILNVAGARPNFMKVAPLIRALAASGAFEQRLVHTGQHYDASMSQVFFDELGIPAPDVNLEVGPGERLAQIDRIMERFEPVVLRERPHAVLVVGDVNSTVACARIARKHGVKVVHVEAGLRSFDATMPEELNRVETDRLSDYLFVTEPSGMTNLELEGIAGKRFLVGNVMIDTLVGQLARARTLRVCARFGLEPRTYFAATFHRPSNVDSSERLSTVLDIIAHATRNASLVLPLHPRTRASLDRFGLMARLQSMPRVHLSEPLGYLDFLSLVHDSKGVLTDSGGVQEETTYLRIPCITMRDNTERPVTVDVGSNVLAGTNPNDVKCALDRVVSGCAKVGAVPELWDGHAAERIVDILQQELKA
jgi:UDP-N-acetylglucosamine 2-epimerase (non-hydrolysing)